MTAPRSPEDILAAHDTWRTIDFSGADVPPIRAVSSESIMLQQAVQDSVELLAGIPFGEAEPVFSDLAGHTSKCLQFLERNLTSIAAESSSVEVCQQAMHALSHSTVLQRVWSNVKGFVSKVVAREEDYVQKYELEAQKMKQEYEARIASLEKRVVELTPEPLPICAVLGR